jgi:hypothetical protein
MDDWVERVRSILDGNPTRALPFSRIIHSLNDQGATLAGRKGWVFKRMMEHPGTFKIIPDRLGPWTLLPSPGSVESSRTEPGKSASDPWILASATPPSDLGTREQLAGRIQESLQAWGWSVDDGSPAAVARWIAANGEAEQVIRDLFISRPPRS